MKSARALVPILIVVLLVCTMALTFAWFAQTMEEVKVGNAFTIGDTNYVYLTDEGLPEGADGTIVGTLLNTTKFNGELGFGEDGKPYPSGDPDAAYVAEYKIGVFMQGSEDLTLAVNFEGLTVTLGEGMTTGVTTERLWIAVFSGAIVPHLGGEGDERCAGRIRGRSSFHLSPRRKARSCLLSRARAALEDRVRLCGRERQWHTVPVRGRGVQRLYVRL